MTAGTGYALPLPRSPHGLCTTITHSGFGGFPAAAADHQSALEDGPVVLGDHQSVSEAVPVVLVDHQSASEAGPVVLGGRHRASVAEGYVMII